MSLQARPGTCYSASLICLTGPTGASQKTESGSFRGYSGLNLIRQVRSFFDGNVRARGERYDRDNRVELESVEPGQITARVEGTSAPYYSVRMTWEDEDPLFVLATCTCPHYAQGEFCKHLWATLQIFADGLWEFDEDHRQILLQHAHDLGHWPAPGQGEQKLMAPSAAGKANGKLRRDIVRAHAQSWSRLLQVAGSKPGVSEANWSPSQPPEADREMWLLVDLARSVDEGSLILGHFFRQRKRNGEFGKVRREGVCRADLSRYADSADRHLLSLLIGNDVQLDEDIVYRNPADEAGRARRTSRRLIPELYDLLLPELATTGRLCWTEEALAGNRSPDSDQLHALRWQPAEQWHFALQVEPVAQGARLLGTLRCADKTRPVSDAKAAIDDGLLVFDDALARLADRRDASWVNAFKDAPTQFVPTAEFDDFLVHWWDLAYHPRASMPDALKLEERTLSPTGRIAIGAKHKGTYIFSEERRVDVSFDYGPLRVTLDTNANAIVDLETRQVTPRVIERERELVDQLHQLGVKWKPGYYGEESWHAIGERRIEALSRSLLDFGWAVQIEGVPLRQSTAFELEVHSGIDWFDLDGQIDFEGQQVDLPTLLEARARGQSHVKLADGTVGMLPDAWLDEYEHLAALGKLEDGRLRLRHTQATMLDALLMESAAADVRIDEQFRRWKERLNNLKGILPTAEPAHFEGELRPYQKVGLGWLKFLDELGVGGCLADDMGLGKTVQIIALLADYRASCSERDEPALPSLVVLPRSLVWNWQAELSRFAPHLAVVDYTGSGRRNHLDNVREADVMLTTYGTMRRDIGALREIHFRYAVLDEAQAIKNAKSLSAKACRLIDADQRLAITGTPVENHLGELWSLFEFLNPGLLGSAKAFTNLTRSSKNRTDPETAAMLGQGLRPFILRRTKEEVLTELPSKTEQTLFCDLGTEQRAEYEELRDYYRSFLDERISQIGLAKSKIHVLEALLRLRQAACHPGLVDASRGDETSAKLDVLMERLEDIVAEVHKALVFSQFTRFLALVRKAADARSMQYSYLDGQTRRRDKVIGEFQDDPNCSLFLISLKAGGHGLNLTAADYVFILDPWWNPAVEAQAIARAHRLGQQRPVFAYRLIAKDTVEEKIAQLQERKRELAEQIVTADEGLIRTLNPDDLAILLG